MDNLILDLRLPVKHVNVILAHLGKGSFETVNEVIAEIQKQGTPQVDAERQRLAQEDQKPIDGEILPPDKAS